jgi:hypothetical protein
VKLAMTELIASKVDGVVRDGTHEEQGIPATVLDESHFELPIRQRPYNSRKLDTSTIVNDRGTSDVDDNSTPGSWQGVATLNADAPDEIRFEGPRNRPRIFGLRPTYDEFYDAVKRGDTESVKTMLDDGANIERQDDEGASPLIIAIYASQIDMITLLLERGADFHYPIIDSPPIFHAVMQGRTRSSNH